MRHQCERNIRCLFLLLITLALLMIIWYSMFSIHQSVRSTRFSEATKRKLSDPTMFLNFITINNNKEQEMKTAAHSKLYKIPYFIFNSIHRVFSLLWWNLFAQLDLQQVPQTVNITDEVNEETLFIYKAYLDQRRPEETLIRILAFSQCRDITVTLHYGQMCISGKNIAVENECPWKWVPKCRWFSFMLIFNMRDTNFSASTKNIYLTKKNHAAIVPLNLHPHNHQNTLHVCVPPLYWYWNYAAFIQFIEIWKRQGATMFHIYYVSVSRQMMDILKIYEKMGVIQLIRWQMMPRSHLIDPNRWIYRFGHTLSINDCLYRVSARYVALVDTDEFIIPSSGTLLQFLHEMHAKNDKVGSFVFEHARVRFQGYKDLKLKSKFDFDWLKDAEYQIREGPSKTIFMPERVQIMTTHRVREFFKPHKPCKIAIDKGLLYHARSNWIFTTLNNFTFHPMDLFQKYITPLKKQYQKLLSQVQWVEENPIHLWKLLSSKIEGCLSEWRRYGCKAPYHLCHHVLKDQADWIFSHTNVSSDYTLL